MNSSPEEQAFINAISLISPLIKSGVKHFVVSPGFRNSPLILSLLNLKKKEEGKDLNIHTHIDERGAAFFALGLAKVSKSPAAIICTSGTALANYHPAVLEAYYSHTPLIVISADRPKELIGVGANQAMIQKDFFGKQVRFHRHFEADDSQKTISEESFNAFTKTLFPTPGPIHLNIAFREPFFLSTAKASSLLLPQIEKQVPFLENVKKHELTQLAQKLKEAKNPIFSLGPEPLSQNLFQLIKNLADKINAPLFIEKSSGISFHLSNNDLISHFDFFLRNQATRKALKPDFVLRIGAPLTNKFWNMWLDESLSHEFIFDHHGEKRNPGKHPATFLECHLSAELEEILNQLIFLTQEKTSHDWKSSVLELEHKAQNQLKHYLKTLSDFTEWQIHQELTKLLPNKSQLFLGNSMAIRDFDAVATALPNELSIFSNRGLSGIDGLIASALGVTQKSGIQTFLLLGDLSALHDLNSLILLKKLKLPFTIMVVNNKGGEIFRLIKTAEEKEEAHYFTTPQETNFKGLAQAFELHYEEVHSINQMRQCFTQKTLPQFIEFFVDTQTNTQTRLDFWKICQN